MKLLKTYQSIFLGRNIISITIVLISLFLLSYSFSFLLLLVQLLLGVFILLILADFMVLYMNSNGVLAHRALPQKLSNGDLNDLFIHLENRYKFKIHIELIDEVPIQFQMRKNSFLFQVEGGEKKKLKYQLRPTKRGEYRFGSLNVFVQSPIGLLCRKFIFDEGASVPVYPSFIQMRKFELLAFSKNLKDFGFKKIRKIGASLEFEQIKEYVQGDDYRNVNWKASAKKNQLMANQYQDERAQDLYCIIDKGRLMKMPFEGLSLLDYSINTSLAISNIALKKYDKVGLLSFSDKMSTFTKADNKAGQMFKLQEQLYSQKTFYKDANFEMLNILVKQKIAKRSLLLFYTNFESRSGLNRQLKYLQALSQKHLLVIIFFVNTELEEFAKERSESVKEIYQRTIAEKFEFEKKLIVKDLKNRGIHTVLTRPENLTVNTINKYLELKARNLI